MVAAAGFPSRYLNGSLPLVLSASLNKTFLSFLREIIKKNNNVIVNVNIE